MKVVRYLGIGWLGNAIACAVSWMPEWLLSVRALVGVGLRMRSLPGLGLFGNAIAFWLELV
jgi:hypothetical protein